ncbi:MAG TPA: hypothetical protein VNA19_03080 [Pyrinomonadaceae bacterium]|jgi:hypothetical protein|nr:hypothetical protein [Pyrinomonadaceae bacterium]
MFYAVLICALALLCVAAVEFCYMMFLESVVRQHKRRVSELERENAALRLELEETESLLQTDETDGELWPEVLDRDDYRVR